LFRGHNCGGIFVSKLAYANPAHVRALKAVHVMLKLAKAKNNGCDRANNTNRPDQEFSLRGFPVLQ
jgi:hypothetical protein